MLYLFEDFVLDTDRRELRRGADVVAVAPQVFDVLDYLIGNRERVVSKDDLVTAIWDGRVISDAALGVSRKPLRRAFRSLAQDHQRLRREIRRPELIGAKPRQTRLREFVSRLFNQPNQPFGVGGDARPDYGVSQDPALGVA